MVFSRTAAPSGRHYAAPERSGRAPAFDGSLHAGARLGAPAKRALLGTARRHEPCPALARPTSRYGGARAAGVGLRPLHRRFRDGRPARGEKLIGALSVSRHRIFVRRTAGWQVSGWSDDLNVAER